MGNILYGERQENQGNEASESVINLSDNCIERLTLVENPNEISNPQDIPITIQNISEDEWMKAVKCMDDIHSKENCLTLQDVEDLFVQVQSQMNKIRPRLCNTESLIMCLQKQENCMIKCKRLIDEFIDCVDKYRIDIIKEKTSVPSSIQPRQNANDVANEYLKIE